VDVKMGDGLSGVLALVHDETVAGEPLLLGDAAGGVEEKLVITRVGNVGDPGDRGPGHDQDVNRRLGNDVSKGDAMIV